MQTNIPALFRIWVVIAEAYNMLEAIMILTWYSAKRLASYPLIGLSREIWSIWCKTFEDSFVLRELLRRFWKDASESSKYVSTQEVRCTLKMSLVPPWESIVGTSKFVICDTRIQFMHTHVNIWSNSLAEAYLCSDLQWRVNRKLAQCAGLCRCNHELLKSVGLRWV